MNGCQSGKNLLWCWRNRISDPQQKGDRALAQERAIAPIILQALYPSDDAHINTISLPPPFCAAIQQANVSLPSSGLVGGDISSLNI